MNVQINSSSSHKSVRIGIDIHSTLGQKTGLGTSTHHLVHELSQLVKAPMKLKLLGQHQTLHMNTFRRLFWENIELPRQAQSEKIDLLHIPAFAPPLFKAWKLVLTVYDIIGMKYKNQLNWPSAFYWGTWIPAMSRRADAIITSSEHTKRDLLVSLRLKESKIHVIPISGHENFTSIISPEEILAVKSKFKIQNPYFLFVGTLEPRKNLGRALEAFGEFLKTLESRNKKFQFVVAGSKSFGRGHFFESVSKKLGDGIQQVVFPGYLTHEELNALYCGAEAFVFPSLYEGFGIPVLEAMAAGAPVIASAETSVPEVTGDAALLVNPHSTESITSAMIQITKDPALKKSLTEKGFQQIQKFSWRQAALDVIKVYESLL